jgi:hypothetical protein
MDKTLFLQVEAAGCMTTCMHCWAQGHPYPMMPYEDVERVVSAAANCCAQAGYKLAANPMHDTLAHPRAADILRLFQPYAEFDPIPTTGVPLAARDDWRDLLETVSALGTTTLWFTFHGVEAVHDRLVNRRGAFGETVLAVQRAKESGFRCGCNVYLTRPSIAQFDELRRWLIDRLRMDELAWEVADYTPTARHRQYADAWPELGDLQPLASSILETAAFHREQWANLAECAEGAHVRRALSEGDATTWVDPRSSPERIWVVCDSRLDLYSGDAGLYGPRHGNLRADPPGDVFGRAIARGPVPEDELYFASAPVPAVPELARRVGDPNGREVHWFAPAMRNRWLDRLFAGSLRP